MGQASLIQASLFMPYEGATVGEMVWMNAARGLPAASRISSTNIVRPASE